MSAELHAGPRRGSKPFRLFLVGLCAGFALAGCTRRLSQPDSPALTRVDMLLAESAAESSAANRAVAEIESETSLKGAAAPAPVLPGQGTVCPSTGARQRGVGCPPYAGSGRRGAAAAIAAVPAAMVPAASRERRLAEQEAIAPNGRTLTDGDARSAGVVMPEELREIISIDWDGPIEPVIRRLARQAGWGYATKGATPGVPVTVTLHRREQPLWTIVRDAGVLVTDRAAVVIDMTSRQFEVRYGR